jgi:hypothetical protein
MLAMPRYSLRTLMAVMLLGGPVCAWEWWMLKVSLKEKAASPAMAV